MMMVAENAAESGGHIQVCVNATTTDGTLMTAGSVLMVSGASFFTDGVITYYDDLRVSKTYTKSECHICKEELVTKQGKKYCPFCQKFM